MLYVAKKPMMGVISGFIKPGSVMSLGRESKHFNGVAVNIGKAVNLFIHKERITSGDIVPVREAFAVYRVYNLAGDDVYELSAVSELEALDTVLETETGQTIRSVGGFDEGKFSYGAGDYAVLKRK